MTTSASGSIQGRSSPDGSRVIPLRRQARIIHQPEIRRRFNEVPADTCAALRSVRTGQSAWPLFLYGPTGTGKTCAALAFMDWLDVPVTGYERFDQLATDFAEVRRGEFVLPLWRDGIEVGHGALNPAEFWRWWDAVDLRVIDDIGLRRPSDSQYEALYAALETRRQRPTIWISNLTLRQIGDVYDGRIESRLAAGTVHEMVGADRRRSQ